MNEFVKKIDCFIESIDTIRYDRYLSGNYYNFKSLARIIRIRNTSVMPFVGLNYRPDIEFGQPDHTLVITLFEKDYGAVVYIKPDLNFRVWGGSHNENVDIDRIGAVIINKKENETYIYENKKLELAKPTQVSKIMTKVRIPVNPENGIKEFTQNFLNVDGYVSKNKFSDIFINVSESNITGARLKKDILDFMRSDNLNKKVLPKLEKFNMFDEITKIKKRDLHKNSISTYTTFIEEKDGELLVGELRSTGSYLNYVGSEETYCSDDIKFITYIDKKGKVEEYRVKPGKNLVKIKYSDDRSVLAGPVIFMTDPKEIENLKYKQEILNDITEVINVKSKYQNEGVSYELKKEAPALYDLIKLDILEQLYAAGFDQIIVQYLTRHVSTYSRKGGIETSLEDFFGPIDYEERKLHNKLGLNKTQMNFFKESKMRHYLSPKVMKYILGDSNDPYQKINNISQQEFNLIVQVFEKMNEIIAETITQAKYSPLAEYPISEIMICDVLKTHHDVNGIDGLRMAIRYFENVSYLPQFIEHIHSYHVLYEEVSSHLDDNYKINFSNLKELNSRIEELTQLRLYVLHKEEREKFAKRYEILKKYECEDGDYIVKVPESPVELIQEGSELSHCVASYVGRHSSGDTNILFVRSKNDPDVPLYTLELSKTGRIVQFRGRFNTTPHQDARDFVTNRFKREY